MRGAARALLPCVLPAACRELRPQPLPVCVCVCVAGLGTGTAEMRSDGSFHDWLLENQGPGLIHSVHKSSLWPGGKVAKPEFVLGMRTATVAVEDSREGTGTSTTSNSAALTLRTSPPAGLPAAVCSCLLYMITSMLLQRIGCLVSLAGHICLRTRERIFFWVFFWGGGWNCGKAVKVLKTFKCSHPPSGFADLQRCIPGSTAKGWRPASTSWLPDGPKHDTARVRTAGAPQRHRIQHTVPGNSRIQHKLAS